MMTWTTDIERAFDETKVKRGTGATGGQFSSKGGTPAPAGKGKGKGGPRRGDAGNLSFDGKRGTGYGKRGGDKRVRAVQRALNSLGLTDANGKALAVDGKLGPRTTAAIKRWQRKNGLKPDGIITPALLRKLTAKKRATANTPAQREGSANIRPSSRRGTRGTVATAKKKTARKAARPKKAAPAPTKRAAGAPAARKG